MKQATMIEEVRGRSCERNREGGGLGVTPESINLFTKRGEFPYYSDTINSDSSTQSPWHRKVLLSLDGGGIRGYSSLLILQDLMDKIQEIERDREKMDERSEESFKPRHYFDYIAGTSTGGLSALMLGRLQMGVKDALEQYDVVGNKVFGHPRFHFRGAPWPKYSTKRMEAALQDVIRNCLDRSGKADLSEHEVPLKTERDDACRTIFLSHGSDEACSKEDVCLFRSYSHCHSSSGIGEQQLNLQPAQEVPIWEVARAISAAPGYFSDHRIRGYSHTDGGIGASNPAHFCFHEVRRMHEGQDPYLIVSIGAGLPAGTKKKKTIVRRARRCLLKEVKNMLRAVSAMEAIVTDSEKAHEEMREIVERTKAGESKKPAFYYRFNVPGIADVPLGQWKPRRGGVDTKEKLRRQTLAYLRNGEVEKMAWECAAQLATLRGQERRPSDGKGSPATLYMSVR